jgi:hypothetical protein
MDNPIKQMRLTRRKAPKIIKCPFCGKILYERSINFFLRYNPKSLQIQCPHLTAWGSTFNIDLEKLAMPPESKLTHINFRLYPPDSATTPVVGSLQKVFHFLEEIKPDRVIKCVSLFTLIGTRYYFFFKGENSEI